MRKQKRKSRRTKDERTSFFVRAFYFLFSFFYFRTRRVRRRSAGPTATRSACAHPRRPLALLPSGPDAIRGPWGLHKFRAAVRPVVCSSRRIVSVARAVWRGAAAPLAWRFCNRRFRHLRLFPRVAVRKN